MKLVKKILLIVIFTSIIAYIGYYVYFYLQMINQSTVIVSNSTNIDYDVDPSGIDKGIIQLTLDGNNSCMFWGKALWNNGKFSCSISKDFIQVCKINYNLIINCVKIDCNNNQCAAQKRFVGLPLWFSTEVPDLWKEDTIIEYTKLQSIQIDDQYTIISLYVSNLEDIIDAI